MNKTYRVTLTQSQRAALGRLIAAGTSPARDLIHARILLKADEGNMRPSWTDQAIATALEVNTSTVERVRRRFAEHGLQAAVHRQSPRREYRRKLTGEQE